MARQAEASLQQEFGLPLGLIGIDTIAACAGYSRAGDEIRQCGRPSHHERAEGGRTGARVFRPGHRPLRQEPGSRHPRRVLQGKLGDLVLACLGNKELSGSVTKTRLAVRKNRSGRQGQEYPFVLRTVEAPRRTRTATRSRPWWWIGCRLELPAAQAQPEPDLGRNPGGKTSARRCCG